MNVARAMTCIICIAFGGLPLTACDSLAVSTVGGPTVLYAKGDLDYAGGGRDFRVVVLDDGTTLGGHETLQQAVVSGLQKAIGPKTHFSATPQTHNPDFKAVLLFAPLPGVSGGNLCREPPDRRTVPKAGNDLHVLAVFCRKDDVLTEIDAYVSGVQKPGDGRFYALMSAIALTIFPSGDARVGEVTSD